MKRLETIHIVQFSFFEADSFELRGNLALLGPNGVGKTSILDAIQIAMLGAHGNYVEYNSQSVSTQRGRSLKDYCLGVMRPDNAPGTDSAGRASLVRKRDYALSYITLVFSDTSTGESVSAGICLSASISEPQHRLKGLYVCPGVALTLGDHLQAIDIGTAPLDWGSFQVELQNRSKAAGRTLYVSIHPEAYIDELLHAIQPKAHHINRHIFLRSFKKSMQLKDIENVNGFLRDYLVDPQPINKQAALTQITRFKDLKALIKETEDQIVELEQLHKSHTSLLNAHRRRDTILAIKAKLEVGQEQKKIDQLKNQLVELNTELSEIRPRIEQLGKEKERLVHEKEDLSEQIFRDPASVDFETNTQMRTVLQSRLNDTKKRLTGWNLQIRQTLQAVCDAFTGLAPDITSAAQALFHPFESAAGKGTVVDLPILNQTRERLDSIQNSIGSHLPAAKQKEHEAAQELKSLVGRIKAADQGGGNVSELIGIAISIFHEHGIEAHPVSALIEIKDSSWQAAIEAFLGPHRESLVVERGKERAAIQLLRQYREHEDWLFKVKIVQPAHLNIAKHRTPPKGMVADLIAGVDEIAITYVRQLMGDLLCVQTEEELERHSRALTTDGMISTNGSTGRLRLPANDDWLIGSRLSASQKQVLYEQFTNAQKSSDQAKRESTLIEQAREAVRTTLKSIELASYSEELNTLRDTQAHLDRLPDPSTIKQPDRLIILREKKERTVESLRQLESSLKELETTETTKKTLSETQEKNLAAAKTNHTTLERKYHECMQAQDYDAEMEQALYQEVSIVPDEALVMAACNSILEKSINRIQIVHNSVLPAFSKFIDHYNVPLIEQRSDWRLAKKWVEARLSKLQDSDLVNYKSQAEDALKAAEDAFRQDVAYRLREAIHQLEMAISQLNKILKTCPPFSGNERYQFIAEPAKAHERIYNFIKNVDKASEMSGSLFSGESDAHQDIVKFLEASASPEAKKMENPLEDYRLLYKFDLKITQGEELVGFLSQRMGVASNGEHRVPFYVIAGAALAAAYRIQSGKKNDGAALMLLDEAFYGIDSQNSYATAQFLKSLGLQLIMAGPEADQGKLGPMTDSLYELTRYDADVFYEMTHFTEKMHELMTSDMPMLHPQLIDHAEKAIVEGEPI